MSEKRWRFIVTILFLLTALVILVNTLPHHEVIVGRIWGWLSTVLSVIGLIVTAVTVVAAPIVLGFFARKKFITAIDPDMDLFSRATICLLSAIVTGVFWIALPYLIATAQNWLAGPFGWETWIVSESTDLPMILGIYGCATFLGGWWIAT